MGETLDIINIFIEITRPRTIADQCEIEPKLDNINLENNTEPPEN